MRTKRVSAVHTQPAAAAAERASEEDASDTLVRFGAILDVGHRSLSCSPAEHAIVPPARPALEPPDAYELS